MGKYGQNWFKKKIKTVNNGKKMVKYGQKRSKMVKTCQKWSKMIKYGQKQSKLSKTAKNG